MTLCFQRIFDASKFFAALSSWHLSSDFKVQLQPFGNIIRKAASVILALVYHLSLVTWLQGVCIAFSVFFVYCFVFWEAAFVFLEKVMIFLQDSSWEAPFFRNLFLPFVTSTNGVETLLICIPIYTVLVTFIDFSRCPKARNPFYNITLYKKKNLCTHSTQGIKTLVSLSSPIFTLCQEPWYILAHLIAFKKCCLQPSKLI